MSEMKATRVAYGETLVELGAVNKDVVVLDADLSNATQTNKFSAVYPDRFINCGIAEADLMAIGAGLSAVGKIPFCSTFAVFGTGRAFEIIRNSIGYPHLNVKIACTHGGVTVGEDGASHQSFEDVALMREIPGMTVICPSDATEARQAVFAAAEMNGPVYLRFAREKSSVLPEHPFEIGKAVVLKEGTDAVIFVSGFPVAAALEAAEKMEADGKDIAVVDVHTIKPIDKETILKYALQTKNVITIEDHSVIGGLGSAVAEVLCGVDKFKFTRIGLQDTYGTSGKARDVLEYFGLTAGKIEQSVLETFG